MSAGPQHDRPLAAAAGAGGAAIVIAAWGQGVAEGLGPTLASVSAGGGSAGRVLVAVPEDDAAAAEAAIRDVLGRPDGGGLHAQIVTAPGGASAAVACALQECASADVALLVAGVTVSAGWLERLRGAAVSDSTVASATPLSVGPGAIDITLGAEPGPTRAERGGGEQDAARVAGASLRTRPRVGTVGPACAYLRRSALELDGRFGEREPLPRALADWGERVLARGLVHVAADDVLVGAAPARADAGTRVAPGPDDDAVQSAIAADEKGPLRTALRQALTTLRGLSVTVDARALTGEAAGGTQTYVAGLVNALAREPDVSVRALVAPDFERSMLGEGRAPEVALLHYHEALAEPGLSDVVHRPQQVFTVDDLALLRLVGERIVVSQQDLIAYRNPSYHADLEAWSAYRRVTRLAFAASDQVVFFSQHAREDAVVEGLATASRANVVGIAVEPQGAAAPVPPSFAERIARRPFLLCLGADYAHKNRPFAIELLRELRVLGWDGLLVLAGAHVPHGSSAAEERRLLHPNEGLAEHVIDAGPVSERVKQWLLANARALAYPTTYEGFGLLPLEAGRAGIPCLFAPQASLRELAGAQASLVPWDPAASADAVLALLHDGEERARHVRGLAAIAAPTWERIARDLIAVYRRAIAAPPAAAAARAWQELDREAYIVRLAEDVDKLKGIAQEYQDAYHALEARVAVGLPLIDEGGLLTHAQQRGLMRLAARRRVGSVVLGPLGALGRAGKDGRAGRDPEGGG